MIWRLTWCTGWRETFVTQKCRLTLFALSFPKPARRFGVYVIVHLQVSWGLSGDLRRWKARLHMQKHLPRPIESYDRQGALSRQDTPQ